MRQTGDKGTCKTVLLGEMMSELPSNMKDKFNTYYLLEEEKYLFDKYVYRGNVLDLCCGTGRVSLYLHEEGCTVRGYELDLERVLTAKQRFPYLDIRKGNVEDLSESRNMYDYAICAYNSLGYTNILKTIECLEKTLKPGGLFIFSALNIRWWLLGSLLF
jgi:2-polyprenyl-3-methyl-5-hydroxy-6-metoxy-1,4-benzoquinol methylase